METYLLIFVIGITLLFIIAPIMRLRTLDNSVSTIKLNDTQTMIAALIEAGTDDAFMIIAIPETALDDNINARIRITLENNTAGLDWVLTNHRNLEDLPLFLDHIQKHGLTAVPLKKHRMKYMRVENAPDFAALAESLLKDMYSIDDSMPLPVILSGFSKPKAA
ncbi:hypothetical protein [Marinicella sp. W31]|uniref:hypothetical protein n=1 Tax=Marinicella sp. W31 TaxID=3023713 RepID=UPI0037581F2D